MLEPWSIWLLVVGFAIGAATVTVLIVRLPRGEDDVDREERRSESAWIAGIIERYGGVAPVSLVEEVLDLHAAYLQQPRPPRPLLGQAAGADPSAARDRRPVPPAPGPPPGYPPSAPPPGYLPAGPPPGYPPAEQTPRGG